MSNMLPSYSLRRSCASPYPSTLPHVHAYMHTCAYAHMHTCTCANTHAYVYMCVCHTYTHAPGASRNTMQEIRMFVYVCM